jgi:hypothetical protein
VITPPTVTVQVPPRAPTIPSTTGSGTPPHSSGTQTGGGAPTHSKHKEHHPHKIPLHAHGHHSTHQGHSYHPLTHPPVHITKHPSTGITATVTGNTKDPHPTENQSQLGSPSHNLSTTHQPVDFSNLHNGSKTYIEEVVEPGIMNKDVEIYRSNDSEEAKFKDAIPMDDTGFHLIILGTKEPTF